jgi:hypothetical protein
MWIDACFTLIYKNFFSNHDCLQIFYKSQDAEGGSRAGAYLLLVVQCRGRPVGVWLTHGEEQDLEPELQFVISAPAPRGNLISAPQHCF